MDAPFGIVFLKKAELYNVVQDQRKKAKNMKLKHPDSPNPITWPVEEKILKWSYHGHKYLADPLKLTDFKLKNSRKLGDWELLDKNKMINLLVENKLFDKNELIGENNLLDENKLFNKIKLLFENNQLQLNQNEIVKQDYQQAVKQPESIFKNMVARGYARCADEISTNEKYNRIIINKEGLLLGEVVYIGQERNYFLRAIYRIYSWLVDYIGALILLLVFVLTITILIINLINIFRPPG